MRRFRGLLSNEDGTIRNEKFAMYFSIVDQAAKDRDCIFFISEADGHEFYEEDMEGDDLWGWLIPRESADEFEKLWAEGKENDEWDDYFLCAEWRREADGYPVEFVDYSSYL